MLECSICTKQVDQSEIQNSELMCEDCYQANKAAIKEGDTNE